MSKINAYRAFGAGIVIILITAGCGGAKKTADKPIPAARAADVKSASQNVPVKETAVKTVLSKKKYGREDPFAPNVSKKQSPNEPASLNLQGIAFNGDASSAIVNNQIVGIGGKVSGNTVKEIRENSVIFNDGTEDFEIRLMRKK